MWELQRFFKAMHGRIFFLDVVDAAKLRYEGSNEDPVFWFDVFSVSQHKANVRPFEWWNSAFLNDIGVIGKVLMLIQPFESEVMTAEGKYEKISAWTTLTSVWCVFELFACESTRSEFEVIMTKGISARFLNSLVSNEKNVLNTLFSVDST